MSASDDAFDCGKSVQIKIPRQHSTTVIPLFSTQTVGTYFEADDPRLGVGATYDAEVIQDLVKVEEEE